MKQLLKKISTYTVLIVLLSMWGGGRIIAQDKTISGQVVGKNGEPLPFVSVLVKGSNKGATTDENGNFAIETSLPVVLKFRFIGFQDLDLKIEIYKTLQVTLLEDATILDEVVVTGYGGTQKRAKLTNSISTVKKEMLATGLHSNPAQALSGAIAGLKVSNSSGKPGAMPTITLRGGTNLDGTGSPLVMVDGQIRGGLNDINPEDIESMEVLKDAGATALYGARASNGVILVTTKAGKTGKAEVNVKARVGFNYLNNSFDFMNGGDYLYSMRNAYKNAAQIWQNKKGEWKGSTTMATLSTATPYGTGNLYFDPNDPNIILDGNKDARAVWSPMILSEQNRFLLQQGWNVMKDPVYGNDIIYKEFDYADAAFKSPAITQDYNINLTGGNEKGKYYASFGYYNDNGLPIETFYRRFTTTLNGEYKIKPWLTSTSNFNFADAKWKDVANTSEGNYFARMLSTPPTMRGTNANGEILLGQNSGDGNPQKNIDAFIRNNNSDKFTMGQSFKFDIIEGLFLKASALLMYDESHNESFNKDYLKSPNNWDRTRTSSASFDRTIRQTYNAILNYQTTIADNHSISALGGIEFYDVYNKGFNASGSGAPTDDFMDLGLTSTAENKRGIDSWHSRQRILSFMGRLNYDYRDKYLLSFTFRRDGYSVLVNNRWGFFPGVSGGWVFSKENFWESIAPIISFGKLRASYGVNGNAGLGDYQLQGSYSTTKYDGATGYRLGNLPLPDIRWERSNTFEIGADFGILNNLLNFNATYYRRTTTDKFAYITLPSTSGVSSILSNNGTLRNTGVELELGVKLLRNTKNWLLDINVNGAYNKNTIVDLPYNGLEKNRQDASQIYNSGGDLTWVGGYQEGQSPGGMYAHVAQGIFKSEDEILRIAANRKDITTGNNGSNGKTLYGPQLWEALTDDEKAKGFPIQPGDVIWKDVNGDGVIDNFDKEYVGNSTPKWIGGFSSTLSWSGLSLFARFDYALGHKQVDNIRPWFMGCMQGSFNSLNDTKDSWTTENPDAKYPKYYWADQLGKRNYARSSDMFVYNSSYLCFREISLSYNLPKKWITKIRLADIQVSVTGQNLGYLTGSKLYSPEVGGGIGGGYALPRTLIFATSITF